MTEILKAIVGNASALNTLLVAAVILVFAAAGIFVGAFVQGRSISFWPPNIGPKPIPASPSPLSIDRPPQPVLPDHSTGDLSPSSDLSIKAGTKVPTSAGGSVVIESNSYTGVQATLMRGRDQAGNKVIVKLFWRGLNPSSNAWAAFSREFKATENLQHRNIVRAIDRGLWNGYPFIVFEFLPGGTLYDLIKSRDRIPGPEILSIAEQVASGLDYAHSQGRIHRDITPSNILFESDPLGRVAISDFGIARILGAFEARLTAASPGFEGTPAYVAPEVFRSRSMTSSVDVYSFGVVLFEMIAGRSPFPEVENIYELFQLKLHQDVPRLRDYKAVPAALDARLAQTLDPNPDSRPKTARDVLSGIEKILLKL